MGGKSRNIAGSGLVWALAVGGFLMILVTATLTVAFHYSQAGLVGRNERQAHLTARSGAALVVSLLTTGGDEGDAICDYLAANGHWQVEDIGFREEMGRCALAVTLLPPAGGSGEQNRIEVTAIANVAGEERKITATLVGVIARATESGSVPPRPGNRLSWYLSSYTEGGEEDRP